MIIFPFLISLLVSNVFAGNGIIVVLETPLFEKADVTSKILGHVRKGDKIYLHDADVGKAPTEVDFDHYNPEVLENRFYEITEQNEQGFFRTTDQHGHDAFILTGHVKPIYQDDREYTNPITPYKKDPTDYRLAEPLPKEYPLYEKNKYRAGFLFSVGAQDKAPYPHPSFVTKEEYSSRNGLKFYYVRNMLSDENNRFFFGGLFNTNAATSERTHANGYQSEEVNKQAGLGPIMTYDFFRKKNLTISAIGGILVAVNETKVRYKRNDNFFDTRTYEGLSFIPNVGTNLQFQNIIPHIDLVAAINMELNLPHSEKSDAASEPVLWQNPKEDTFSRGLMATYSLQFGIQTTY